VAPWIEPDGDDCSTRILPARDADSGCRKVRPGDAVARTNWDPNDTVMAAPAVAQSSVVGTTDPVALAAEASSDHAADHGLHRSAASRNTVALLASRLTIAALGWAGTVLIARHLSPTDWGVFSFVFGLLGMMSIVTDLGVGRVVLARLLEADPAEADVVASSFVSLRAVLGLFGYGIAVAYVVIMGYSGEVIRATALAGLVVVVATPSHALAVLYQSRLKLATVAASEACAQLVQLILTILAALTMPTLFIFILPAVANELFSGTWKLIGVRRGWLGPRVRARPSLKLWRGMLAEAVPLSVGLAMVTLLTKVDILLLARFDRFDSVGLYTVAYKFADLASYAVLAVVTPLATLLVAVWPTFPDEFRLRVRSAAITIALVTCLGVVVMWASAEPVIALLYGARFSAAADATRLLLVGGVFAALTQLVLMTLISAGRQRGYPWVAVGALALNVGLNVLLIPRFSFNGSAWATVLTEMAMLFAMWVLLARTVPVRKLLPASKLAVVLLLTVGTCAATSIVPTMTTMPWVLVGLLAAVLFVVGACALRLVDESLMKRFLPTRWARG
jgi:O-antigen/teichoic acid export membrane protein